MKNRGSIFAMANAGPARLRGIMPFNSGSLPGSEINMTEVLAAVHEMGEAYVGFRQRNEARIEALEGAMEGALRSNAAATLGGLGGGRNGGAGGRVLSAQTASEFRNLIANAPMAAMRTQSGPDGGFTVPEEVDSTIDALLRDISPMRRVARVVTMGQGNSWSKVIGQTGAQTYWAGEEDDRIDTSSPTLGMAEIVPRELYAVPSITNILLEDSAFDLNAFISDDVASEFALAEGAAFISGDGIKRPRGLLTYAATNEKDSVRKFGSLQYVPTGDAANFAATNPIDNFTALVAALRPVYRRSPGTAWLMNSTTATLVRNFKDSTGRPLWIDSIMDGQPDRLLGYPVEFDEGMPDVAAGAFPVAFGNWQRGYSIVDKPNSLRLIIDKVTKKGWTKFYFSRRVGGGLVDSNAIKLLKIAAS